MNTEETLRIVIVATIDKNFEKNDIDLLTKYDSLLADVLPLIDNYSQDYPLDYQKFMPFFIGKIKKHMELEMFNYREAKGVKDNLEEDWIKIGRLYYLQYEKLNKKSITEFVHLVAKTFDNVNVEVTTKYYENRPNYNKNKPSEGCFIATYVYGDYNHPNVIEFREIRDNILKKSHLGNAFINCYYTLSPKYLSIVKDKMILKRIMKRFLDLSLFLYRRIQL